MLIEEANPENRLQSPEIPDRRWALRAGRYWRWASAFGMALMVAGLLVGGRQPIAGGFFVPPADKIAHFGVYGLMSLLLWWALDRGRAWVAVGVIFSIGVADEWQQFYIPGREAGWGDLLADVAGASLILALVSWLKRRECAAS